MTKIVTAMKLPHAPLSGVHRVLECASFNPYY